MDTLDGHYLANDQFWKNKPLANKCSDRHLGNQEKLCLKERNFL